MTKKSFLIAGVLLMVLLSGIMSATTAKIGNPKRILYPKVDFLQTTIIEKPIKVINENNFSVNITIETSREESFIDIIDKEFQLEPGEEKKAEFLINIKKLGDYAEKINIYFTPSEGDSPTIALSSTVTIHAGKEKYYDIKKYSLIVFVILLSVLIIILIKIKKGKKNE